MRIRILKNPILTGRRSVGRSILPKRTTDFHADLLEDLADSRESEAYGNAAIEELDSGRDVGHENVLKWLKSWGERGEKKAPR